MNDVSNLKAPGWSRVVEELGARAAPSDAAFLGKLTAVLGQVGGARQAVLFDTSRAGAIAGGAAGDAGQADPRALLAWPAGPGAESLAPPSRLEHQSEVVSAASRAAGDAQARVFSLDRRDDLYDPGQSGYVLALPVPSGEQSESDGTLHVVTLLIEHRSQQAIQTTVALCEVLTGYTHGHRARQELVRTRASTASLELAARLIASINQASGFRGACIQVCNDLSRQLGLDRAAIGFVRGVGRASGQVRVRAISDTEHLDRRMAMARQIESAMDECFDQRQAVLYPPPPDAEDSPEGDVLLAQAVTHAHRELASSDAKLRVASVPLRVGDEVVGVLTVESAREDSPLSVALVEWLQASMDLVSPVLEVRRRDDRNLALRTMDSARRAGAWAVGPTHTAWKVAALALLALVVAAFVVRIPYRVEAPVELSPRVQRMVSTPFDGVIDSVPDAIEPGASVRAGQVLATLRTTELELSAQQALTEMRQASTRRDALMDRGETVQAEQAQAEYDAARARLDLLQHRIERATLRSPIDGVIVEGDLTSRVGSTVKLGEALFQIARIDDLIATVRVPDRDISFIGEGMPGSIATLSRPDRHFPLRVDSVVPLAKPDEGTNAFEVRATVVDPAPWMMPGMEGLVKLDTGRRSVAWILTRRITDTLRMWLWL